MEDHYHIILVGYERPDRYGFQNPINKHGMLKKVLY